MMFPRKAELREAVSLVAAVILLFFLSPILSALFDIDSSAQASDALTPNAYKLAQQIKDMKDNKEIPPSTQISLTEDQSLRFFNTVERSNSKPNKCGARACICLYQRDKLVDCDKKTLPRGNYLFTTSDFNPKEGRVSDVQISYRHDDGVDRVTLSTT